MENEVIKNEDVAYLPQMKKLTKAEKEMLKEPVFIGEMVHIFRGYSRGNKDEFIKSINNGEGIAEAITEAWIDVDNMYSQNTLPQYKDYSQDMYSICEAILTFYGEEVWGD